MRPRKTVLCVDSNEQVLSIRKFMLETRGYRVLTVASATEALEQLEISLPGAIDLLLSEVILTGMDGNELVRRAKDLQPALPALLVSTTVSNYERGAAADAFLPKGVCTAAEILDRIRVLVARKRGPKKRTVEGVPVGMPAMAAA